MQSPTLFMKFTPFFGTFGPSTTVAMHPKKKERKKKTTDTKKKKNDNRVKIKSNKNKIRHLNAFMK